MYVANTGSNDVSAINLSPDTPTDESKSLSDITKSLIKIHWI